MSNESFLLLSQCFLVPYIVPTSMDCNITNKEVAYSTLNTVLSRCLEFAILASYYLVAPVALVVSSQGHVVSSKISMDANEKRCTVRYLMRVRFSIFPDREFVKNPSFGCSA